MRKNSEERNVNGGAGNVMWCFILHYILIKLSNVRKIGQFRSLHILDSIYISFIYNANTLKTKHKIPFYLRFKIEFKIFSNVVKLSKDNFKEEKLVFFGK